MINEQLVEKRFLYYLVLYMLDEMAQHTHGSTMKHITKRKFEALRVSVPSIQEQRRITRQIQIAFERVTEIQTLRCESLAEVASLERAVFADFVMDYMSQTTSAKLVSLGDILVRAQYGSSVRANTHRDGVPMLRMGNIQNGHLDVADLKHVSLSASDLAKYRLIEGDILFNRTNSLKLVGKAATFIGLEGEWVFASYLVRLEVDKGKALPEYVAAVINSRIGRNYVQRTARRAIGMVNINAKQIQRLKIPLPELADQEWLVGQMRNAKASSDGIIGDLRMEPIMALRESILRKAFAGEL